MTIDNNNQGYTLQEAAEALGVSKMTVRRRVKEGSLKAEKVAGRYGDEYRIELSPNQLTMSKRRSGEDYTALLSRLEQLSQEVGYWRGRYEEVASQVKLLKSPSVPWWRRLFQRGGS